MTLSADEIVGLDECLARARRSAFYADRLNGIDGESFASCPMTLKSDLRERGAAAFLVSREADLLQYHESFGTTGPAAGSWFTRRDYAKDLERVRHWTAPFAGQRVLIRFPYALSMPAHLSQRAVELRGGAVIASSSRNEVCTHVRAVRLMADLEVDVLACSPFESLMLIEASRRLGVPRPTIRALCVAGELLSAGYRRLVEDAWEAPVANLYGATETGALATSCPRNSLHACDGQLVEVLSQDGSQDRLPAGAVGMVVVTTLDREAMPLVRYCTGDFGRWYPAESCGCGRAGHVLEPLGRFRTARTDYATERDLLDLACTVARDMDARFFALELDDAGIRIDVEGTRPVPPTLRDVGIVVRSVATGTLVDTGRLLAEGTARKPANIRKTAEAS